MYQLKQGCIFWALLYGGGTLGKNFNRMSIFQGEVDFSWWPMAILYTPSLSHQLQGTGNMNFDQNIDP